jgi:hypothetical protein
MFFCGRTKLKVSRSNVIMSESSSAPASAPASAPDQGFTYEEFSFPIFIYGELVRPRPYFLMPPKITAETKGPDEGAASTGESPV